jgi:ABC-type lipoprotein release transport system permease subunit
MKNYFKLAWRNLWRNKRRTMITVSSVLFAIFLALLMRSMQFGSYELLERDAIRNSTGFIQIHGQGYWEDKIIDNTLEVTPELDKTIKSDPNISDVIPRIESFALASSGNLTKGVALIGTLPEMEDKITNLKNRLIKGDYFQNDSDQGLLVAEDLAKFLKLDVGDTVVLLSQGYHGLSAAGEFQVRGLLHFPFPEMNKQLIYMTLEASQYFFAAENRLTSYSLMLNEPEDLDKTFANLNSALGQKYEIMTWKEMLIELQQQIQSDSISGMFMLGILYVVVAFGIFGTILMMTLERRKEFSVMIAVGMQRYKLAFIVFLETLYMGFIGVIAGAIVSLPVVYYFHNHPIPLSGETATAMLEFNQQPIIPFAFRADIYIAQAIIVFILTFVIAFYPLLSISRFNLISGLHS